MQKNKYCHEIDAQALHSDPVWRLISWAELEHSFKDDEDGLSLCTDVSKGKIRKERWLTYARRVGIIDRDITTYQSRTSGGRQ